MNMHTQEAQGNLCDEQGKAQKPISTEDYSQNMGNSDTGDLMPDSYSIREYANGQKMLYTIYIQNLV
jgi:hypothetical protein